MRVRTEKGNAHNFAPGYRFGRYTVQRLLARGGMGEVWLGTVSGPGGFAKRVVLKTILPELAVDQSYVRMFINEASLAARLDHPNIVQVFDLGELDGAYYIAMEYVAGATLLQLAASHARQGRLLPRWFVAAVIAEACDGLQYAHEFVDEELESAGVLHRDISLSNVIVSSAGRVALLDFGVATAADGPDKTQSGSLKGKFQYMAPERIRGSDADRRSDIYSVGVLLYELLVGRKPFRGRTEYELFRSILAADAPAPSELTAGVPPELDAIVARAMAADAEHRYQSADALAFDLRGFVRMTEAPGERADIAAFVRAASEDDEPLIEQSYDDISSVLAELPSVDIQLEEEGSLSAHFAAASEASWSPSLDDAAGGEPEDVLRQRWPRASSSLPEVPVQTATSGDLFPELTPTRRTVIREVADLFSAPADAANRTSDVFETTPRDGVRAEGRWPWLDKERK